MSEWTDEEPKQAGASGAPPAWQSQWARSLPADDQGYGNGGDYGTVDSWEPTYDDVDAWVATGYDEPGHDGERDAPDEADDGSGQNLRRVLIGGAAGVAMLVGPIALAHVIVPSDDTDDVEASDAQAIAAYRRAVREQPLLEDAARTGSARAGTTTTTAPPPTTTTTLPPTTTTTVPPTTTTTAAPEPVPPVDTGSGQLGDPYYMPTWDALAECEAGGNWHINTGNGYYGGLQFSLSSWQGVGGTGYPHENSRETQIAMGQRLWESSGWGAWPACTRELGWR